MSIIFCTPLPLTSCRNFTPISPAIRRSLAAASPRGLPSRANGRRTIRGNVASRAPSCHRRRSSRSCRITIRSATALSASGSLALLRREAARAAIASCSFRRKSRFSSWARNGPPRRHSSSSAISAASLARPCAKGRREEFSRYPDFQDPAKRDRLPDPIAVDAFQGVEARTGAKLERAHHREWRAFYQRASHAPARGDRSPPAQYRRQFAAAMKSLGRRRCMCAGPSAMDRSSSLLTNLTPNALEAVRCAIEGRRALAWRAHCADDHFGPWTVAFSIWDTAAERATERAAEAHPARHLSAAVPKGIRVRRRGGARALSRRARHQPRLCVVRI